jgi:hypothetical protein
MSVRGRLFLGLGLFVAVQLAHIGARGWVAAWGPWALPARVPCFSDLRVTTGAADSLELGLDPREENPGAPFRQRFNLRGVWLGLRDLGVRERHSPVLGLGLLAGYALGVWWLAAGATRGSAVALGALLLSPAALLAVERGTTDLAVFFLVALACHVAARAPRGAMAVVVGAFGLKLFPLAAVLVALREPRARALRLGATVLAGAGVFCAADFSTLVDIAWKTEKGRELSYGWRALALWLDGRGATAAWTVAATVAGAALAAAALGIAAWRSWRARARAGRENAEGRALDFFRAGAGVYVGTFLLGANWDYRLIFTLLLVPQLVAWARTQAIARLTIAALLIACWSPPLLAWAADGAPLAAVRALEELAKWALYCGCVHALARTWPEWRAGRAFAQRS